MPGSWAAASGNVGAIPGTGGRTGIMMLCNLTRAPESLRRVRVMSTQIIMSTLATTMLLV